MAADGGSKRGRRADAGTVRATARDVEGMSWVVEMYGMPLDLLVQLLDMSEGAARNMLARWRRAGWTEHGRVDAGPMWVWATKTGVERFGRWPYHVHVPSAGRTAHYREVIRARMALERGRRDPLWRSERELRHTAWLGKTKDPVRDHFADGELEFDDDHGNRVLYVVEVEISPKPFERTKEIMRELLATPNATVLYLVNARTKPVVTRARAAMERADVIRVVDIPEGD